MISIPIPTQRYADDYRKWMKGMKDCERVSSKKYGEYLQKKKKRGSKMKLK